MLVLSRSAFSLWVGNLRSLRPLLDFWDSLGSVPASELGIRDSGGGGIQGRLKKKKKLYEVYFGYQIIH